MVCVTVCGGCCVKELLFVGVKVYGSCGVGELWCARVALWWSQCVWGSWWLLKPNSLYFWRFLSFPHPLDFTQKRKHFLYLPHLNQLPWFILPGICNRHVCQCCLGAV